MKTSIVYDTIAGMYIDRVPVYERGSSCKMHGLHHLWILNTAHNRVCIRCGMKETITSYYRFALEAGLLPRISWGWT